MTGPDHAAELTEMNARIAQMQAELGQHGRRHPLYGQLRLMLGTCRMIRFGLTGQRADLDDGIGDLEAAAAAIPAGDPERGAALAGLVQALVDRFQRTDAFADLERAIAVARDAVTTIPADSEYRAAVLASLADALQARYQRTSDPADLDESISGYRAAVGVMGEAGFGREVILGNLALALRIRYERSSGPADLDAAIAAGQQAVAGCPPDNPQRAEYLANLGIAFVRRFQYSGALADADDAIRALRGAMAGLAPRSPHRPGVQSNLAIALIARYRRTGDRVDLDAAISASQAAVETFGREDPRWAGMAGNAGLALYQRYELTGDLGDLDAAITMVRLSGAAMPADHPDHAVLLTQLGTMLHGRFERIGDSADLDGAIRAAYQAVDATPAGHVDRADALVNLGVAVRSRFWLTGLPADRDAALSALLRALEVTGARPSVRARASIGAGLLVSHDPAHAARLLEDAVRLLAEVAPRQLARGDRQHAVGVFAGVAGAAASAALADPSVPPRERPAKALALLEAGRAVLLSQALDTRDDLTDLRRDREDLAARFVAARERLEPEIGPPGDPMVTLGRDAAERQRQAGELAEVLKEIRAIEGFARFGLPPSSDELRAEAAGGPVVAFCAGTVTGAALLLTRDGISAIDLPGLTDEAVTNQVNAFHAALSDVDGDDGTAGRAARRVIQQTLRWLWDTAAGPVLDALGYRTSPAPGQDWPRVWWVPGGKLGLLPLHAAGYDAEQPGPGQAGVSVLDCVISSYIPTVRALRYARQQARNRDGTGRALIVAMPVTPGQQKLAGVTGEVTVVCGAVPASVVLAEPDETGRGGAADTLPTKENVLRYLPACTVAHFACHAASDAADPSRSMLLLRDYQTSPLTVAALATIDHEHLELSYLSACSTAFTAAANLADEAIHLTSAFQLAGSRHVIGTLWPANDLVALDLATSFYSALKTGSGAIETDRAASALHAAVRDLRAAHRDRPWLWAPYLHAGA